MFSRFLETFFSCIITIIIIKIEEKHIKKKKSIYIKVYIYIEKCKRRHYDCNYTMR
jgi:hypothetical protein